MNKKQKRSIVQYLYDISKGLALAVLLTIMTEKIGSAFAVAYCMLGSMIFFAIAYDMEGEESD